MKQFITLFALALICSLSAFAIPGITTSHPYGTGACVGGTCTLADSVAGGVWSSSDPAVASVDASGVVTGVSAGTTTITYAVLAGSATVTFYVTAAPAAIVGPGTICIGATTTFTDATIGGSWTSAVASGSGINSITGEFTAGSLGGSGTVYYVVGTGCYASAALTVSSPFPATDSTITGPSTMCVGGTISLTSTISGGAWSSSAPGVATIDAGGVVTGVSAGTDVISYAVSSSCGTAIATKVISVSATTPSGSISGAGTVYLGGLAITLTGSPSGGTWSSSSSAIATVTSWGSVGAVAVGTATITYSFAGCGAAGSATHVVTVATPDGISGHVIFASIPPTHPKVWLIKYYAPAMDLEALDSMYATYDSSTGGYYYQFNGLATDSFRVKAAISDSSVFSPSGYIPTYHTSSYYWHDADVIYHTSGTSDVNKDINMIAGSGASGPGFIGGSVLTGANKGTSGGVPVNHLRLYAINSATSTLMQRTYTDASGNYSFSNLPYGTYTIFPDSLNYATTPYGSITLSASAATFSAAGFIQHTLSKTITPIPTAIENVIPGISSVSVFPNPASSKLNIFWAATATENADLSITDIAGREVYRSSVSMTKGNGLTTVNVSSLMNGLYLVNVHSASLNYTGKITVQH